MSLTSLWKERNGGSENGYFFKLSWKSARYYSEVNGDKNLKMEKQKIETELHFSNFISHTQLI